MRRAVERHAQYATQNKPQCELEYLRTRSILPSGESEVLRELDEVALLLEALLVAEGLPAERGVYSKLSFLKDVIGDADVRYPLERSSLD